MQIININKGWKFYREVDEDGNVANAGYVVVNLPHTWNKYDGQDGGADYYRANCYYEKHIDLNKHDDKDYYLEFNGVNAIAKVYLNGTFIGEHKGGFSTFRFNVTDHVIKGENTIVVSVDNRENGEVYPQTADFTFFGGIYRDVNFIEANKTRFDLDYFGSEGVMVTPVLNKDGTATINVQAFVTNPLDTTDLILTLLTPDGEIVCSNKVNAKEGKTTFNLEKPELWDGVKSPKLYTINASLEEKGTALDSRNIKVGVRSFSVDKDGFYLNGRKYPLHGVSRHQDRLNKGWAISKEDHEEDMSLIKEIGATTIRLAHYQHDQYFYDLCDSNGMVVWAEIPYISVHMKDGDENALSQMRELVIQNYNHASIMFWGLSNEITIGGECPEQLELHKQLNALVKSLDNTRLTTLAAVTMCDLHSPLLDVPDIFSYNHYMGWYMGEVKDNATWIDEFRKEFPDKPLGYSEYGCEANLALHAGNPRCGDYTEEYQSYYHEQMAEIFANRPWMWSTHCWNMFDFAVDSRDEGGIKGRNNKGLVTYDRKTKKDSFFLYKAWWSDEPFVHIASKRFVKRFGKTMTLKVYSNQNEVSLYRGKKLIETKTGLHVFEFEVPLCLLGAKWTVKSGDLVDKAKFQRVLLPHKAYRLKKEKVVNNWFEKDGVKYEFEFPEGKFSIKDKFNAIYKTPEGEKILTDMVGEALKAMGMKQEPADFLKSTRKLIGGMSIERIASMAGDKLPQEMLYKVNVELNKIDKPQGK